MYSENKTSYSLSYKLNCILVLHSTFNQASATSTGALQRKKLICKLTTGLWNKGFFKTHSYILSKLFKA